MAGVLQQPVAGYDNQVGIGDHHREVP